MRGEIATPSLTSAEKNKGQRAKSKPCRNGSYPPFLCPLSFVLCPLSFVLCPLSFVLCPLSFVLCPLILVLLSAGQPFDEAVTELQAVVKPRLVDAFVAAVDAD